MDREEYIERQWRRTKLAIVAACSLLAFAVLFAFVLVLMILERAERDEAVVQRTESTVWSTTRIGLGILAPALAIGGNAALVNSVRLARSGRHMTQTLFPWGIVYGVAIAVAVLELAALVGGLWKLLL